MQSDDGGLHVQTHRARSVQIFALFIFHERTKKTEYTAWPVTDDVSEPDPAIRSLVIQHKLPLSPSPPIVEMKV
jgi:hypothetical protein